MSGPTITLIDNSNPLYRQAKRHGRDTLAAAIRIGKSIGDERESVAMSTAVQSLLAVALQDGMELNAALESLCHAAAWLLSHAEAACHGPVIASMSDRIARLAEASAEARALNAAPTQGAA